MNQAIFLLGYEVITMIIVLVTTKEKSLGTNFNQQNWMLVIRLWSAEHGKNYTPKQICLQIVLNYLFSVYLPYVNIWRENPTKPMFVEQSVWRTWWFDEIFGWKLKAASDHLTIRPDFDIIWHDTRETSMKHFLALFCMYVLVCFYQ